MSTLNDKKNCADRRTIIEQVPHCEGDTLDLMSRRSSSIELSKTKKEDEQELADDEEEQVDDDEGNEISGLFEKRNSTTWADGGSKKEFVIGKLIKCFGSLVVRMTNEDAQEGEEKGILYKKAPRASINVVRIRMLLKDHENVDTKDFSIFIHKRNWIKSELCPLLELCSQEEGNIGIDRDLAMRCCRLVLVLMRRLKEGSSVSSLASLRFKIGKESKEEARLRFDKQSTTKTNIQEQIAAMLSFKEVLCTAKCARAVAIIFEDLLKKESVESHETTKKDLATCISYVRRMVAVNAIPNISSINEITKARKTHNQFIIYHRAILSTIPAICIDIMDKYHDGWFTDIVMIIYGILRDQSAMDMFSLWKNKKLVSLQELSTFEDYVESLYQSLDGLETKKPQLHHSGAPLDFTKQPTLATDPKPCGLLSKHLALERNSRLKASQMSNRFMGTYKMKPTYVSSIPDASDDQGQEQDKASIIPQRVILLKNPILEYNTEAQAKAKRMKKKKSFLDTGLPSDAYLSTKYDTVESDCACAIVTAVAEALVTSAGLVQLVSRVNEDLRRGDDRISLDLELRYFEALSTLLEYNKLKWLESKKNFDGSNQESSKWIPNMQYVMKSLDKMSFTRVLFTMERLNNRDKRFQDVVIPMKLYKEMLGHLRILLLSDDSDHSELAVAALYRLFFNAASERQDPILRLLAEWKPAVFSREHMNCLVELIAETLETLQLAKDKFRNLEDVVDNLKKKKPNSKRTLDIEQYIVACLRFSVDDYFRRIVTCHTVDMYTRLLSNFASNTATVNKIIFEFMWKLCNFQLEQDHETFAPSNSFLASQSEEVIATAKPTLGHMLFNIQTLVVLSDLLNSQITGFSNRAEDSQSEAEVRTSRIIAPLSRYHTESVQLLQRLAKCVVRRFEEATRKNRLIFLETLFNHPRPQEFCVSMDSVYEAPTYAHQSKLEELLPERITSADSPVEETNPNKSLIESYGDEFDETDAIFAATSKTLKKSKKNNTDKQSNKVNGRAWSSDEDKFLKEKYEIYAGASSVFTLIADDLRARGFGPKRSAESIARRVRELQLHMRMQDTDDELNSFGKLDESLDRILDEVTDDESNWDTQSNLKRKLLSVSDSNSRSPQRIDNHLSIKRRRKIVKKSAGSADSDSDVMLSGSEEGLSGKKEYSSLRNLDVGSRNVQIDSSDDDLF